ncbi:MAG TPA: c-type cytochrome [Vicinamibacterales bacterium]|nr:c-type cytochrome [Vicinamibacterales bacterium]
MRFTCIALAVACAACGKPEPKSPLVGAKTTMVTAWVVPQNPLDGATAAGAGDKRMSDQVRLGFRLFTDTPHLAPRYTGGTLSCSNCHLNAGQRDRALPLVGVAGMFPEYNTRAARFITLADRVVDCFMRSENAPGAAHDGQSGADESTYPTPASKEVVALAAYITWLSRGQAVGTNPGWRGHNAIPSDKLLPVAKLDAQRGEGIFRERCTSCHGADGQGVQIGDKKAGPLWGPNSWNDGAGASRVYTLAGIIRYTMPYLDPGGLTDEDAQHVAAFITSQQRPAYPFKDRDYVGGKIPVDAVYYRATRPASPSQ